MKYYEVDFNDNSIYGVTVSDGELDDSTSFYKPIYEGGKFEQWNLINFILKDGGFADYQMNDMYWHLCSKKMRDVIDKTKSDIDTIQWLNVTVSEKNGKEKKDYYFLHLIERPEIVDREKSTFPDEADVDDPGMVINPYFNIKLIGDRQIFTFRGSEGVDLIVSENIMKALKSAKCSGIEFSRANAG